MNTLTAKTFAWIVRCIPEPVLNAQARRPNGWLGTYVMAPLFAKGNADLNQMILDLLVVQPQDQVLEIGFGPGTLANKIADQLATGKILGLDFSETMVQTASKFNQSHIAAGRMTLSHGCSSEMPFESDGFNKVCTANTLYFWQPVEMHLAEVFRVLKSGGQFVMGFREAAQLKMMGLNELSFQRYECEQVAELLRVAGFEDVSIQSRVEDTIASYCAIATRP